MAFLTELVFLPSLLSVSFPFFFFSSPSFLFYCLFDSKIWHSTGVKRGIKGSQNGLIFSFYRSRKAPMANKILHQVLKNTECPRLEKMKRDF